MNKYLRLILGFFFLSPGGIILLTDSLPKTFRFPKVVSRGPKMDNETRKPPIVTSTRIKRTRSTAEWNASTMDPEEKRLRQEERVKRRKMAMMFAYSGVGYFGLQRNQGMKTIEGDIMTALLKAGLVNEEIHNTPQLIQFQRAARTDKGVSALKQVVSLKLPEAATKEAINEHLPDQIRILSIKRVTKGFNSKNSCTGRTYSYTCPSYAFASPEEANEGFRLSPERFKYLEALLKQYEGTHNFHNFTSKRKPQDPSCSRYIISFQCEQPFMRDGLEMITVKVKGQSFMLHQIRKMVGVVMSVARGHVTEDIMSKAFGLDQYDLPMAPGLGLLLEQVHYELYNEKFGQDGVHESLHFHEEDEEVNKFREQFILPFIVKTEATEKPMLDWLQHLAEFSFDTREVKAARAAALGIELNNGNNTDDEEEDDDEDDNRKGKRNNNRRDRRNHSSNNTGNKPSSEIKLDDRQSENKGTVDSATTILAEKNAETIAERPEENKPATEIPLASVQTKAVESKPDSPVADAKPAEDNGVLEKQESKA